MEMTIKQNSSPPNITEIWPDPLQAQLLTDISRLFAEADDFNVKITVGEEPEAQTFLAHSCILRARSPFFQAALSSKWRQTHDDDEKITFTIPNIQPKVFRIILKYIYTGTITFNQKNDYVSLLTAADQLALILLVDRVQDHIINSDKQWLQRKLVEVFQLCFRYETFTKLREFCLQTISGNPQNFFKSPDFLTLEEGALIDLLKRSDLAMEEIDVWDEVIRWGIAQHKNLSSNNIMQWSSANFTALERTVHQCLPHIRFCQISLADYQKKIIPFHSILPADLKKSYNDGQGGQGGSSASSASPASPGAPSSTSSIDSTIINRKHSALISHWIEGKDGEPDSYRYCHNDFKLLFRGTRDGFDVKEFHARSDRQGATLVVIRISDTDEIVGGYNPISWSSSGYFKTTTRSFIFSLGDGMNMREAILSRVSMRHSAFAICDYGLGNLEDSVGFGAGDLPLFGYKSKRTSYQRQVVSTSSFSIEEFEVFQVCRRTDSSA